MAPTPPSPRPSGRSVWLPVLLGTLFLVTAIPTAIGIGVWSCLRTGSDSRALRTAAIKASGVPWQRQVEFSAGPILLGLARFGLSFAPLDPDGRLAIQAIRGAEVAVFQSPGGRDVTANPAVLNAVDDVMTRRGWDRMVGVRQEGNTVAVYVPKQDPGGDLVHACVLVINEDHLVVVSGRTDLRPLMELVERHRDRHGPLVALH